MKFTPSAAGPDHQSHEALPGLIHEVSAMAEGGFKLPTICDSIRRPTSGAIIRTRQGVVTGVALETERPGSSIRGERRASKLLAFEPECIRYMPG